MIYADRPIAPVENTGTRRLGHPDRPTVDLHRIERAVREILHAIGEDPARDGLLDTPRRVAKAYAEIFRGLREDPRTHLGRVFQQEYDDVVVVGGIDLFSVCEHHLLPFYGQAHIAYRPDGGQVVGLSKLARTVEVFARRPQVQERLTTQIADALVEHLAPRGVCVVVEADHMCMKMRGVSKCASKTTTRVVRGEFALDPAARAEVLRLIDGGRAA